MGYLKAIRFDAKTIGFSIVGLVVLVILAKFFIDKK